MRKMIVLLGPHSHLRPGEGDLLDCRGQRLCGSSLLVSGGVLELPDEEDFLLSILYKAT